MTYDNEVAKQVASVTEKSKIHCVDDLLHSGSTWEIK
jgi:2-oxoglutarate ferredoxin oxidoreductase subunit beta